MLPLKVKRTCRDWGVNSQKKIMNEEKIDIKQARARKMMAKLQLPYNESVMLQKSLLFISVLSQFGKESMMMDYAAGKFHSPDNASVSAEELALFYMELIPAIEPGKSPKRSFEAAQEKLWNVVTQHEQEFILKDTSYKPRICSDWNKIIMSLALNKTYWLAKPNVKKFIGTISKSSTNKENTAIQVGNNEESCLNKSYWLGKSNVNNFVGKLISKSSHNKSTATENKNIQEATLNNSCNKASATDDIITKSIGVNAVSQLKDCAVQVNENIKTANILLVSSDPYSSNKHNPIEENRKIELINNTITNYCNTNNKPNMLCNFCFRSNHYEENCWKKNGLCLACGGEHRVANCIRNKYLTSNLDCTACYGKHQGRFCGSHSDNVNLCSWCSKRGHVASICLKRLRACYYCGDLYHQIKDCARHGRKQKESTDYWWDPSV